MIHYDVQCAKGHAFDGWFRDSAAFDAQASRRLIECPVCGDTEVRRALMAPAVAKPRALPAPRPEAENRQPENPVAVAGEKLPDHIRAMLQRLRAEVEKNCDYVGAEFADEARKIHRGETEARGIYGETTPDEAESLAEEGIEVSRIPWVPRADG